ncbi:pathogenicity island protein [Mammaliicoccus sciuri]|nr:pathogenicity island protein [Mammaliicoccus sciuri]
MPAPENLYALYHNDEGDEVGFSIVCMALTKDDDIKFCDVDDSGYISLKAMTLKNIILKYLTLQS